METEKKLIEKIQSFYKSLMKRAEKLEKDILSDEITHYQEKLIELESEIINEFMERFETLFGEMVFNDDY